MRIGIVINPHRLPNDGATPLIDHMVDIAQRVEVLGFDSLWVTDSFARGRPTLDPMTLLGVLCAATRKIELGTCVVQIPLRHPVEHAHRVQTVNVLSGGRLRFGVGTGSTRADFAAVQADYDTRFRRMPDLLDVMRRTWNGEGVYGPPLPLWPGTRGGPPIFLGAWRSPRWIDLAARHCEGWIASGRHGTWHDAEAGVRLYRDAGGARAVIANLHTDLRTEPVHPPPGPPLGISLICSAAAAGEQLRRLDALGFDDAVLVPPEDDPAQLAAIRDLI